MHAPYVVEPSFCRVVAAFLRLFAMGLCLVVLVPGCHKKPGGEAPTGGGAAPNDEERGSVEDVSIQLEVDKTRVLQKEADLQASKQSLEAEHQNLERERAEAADKLNSISQADKASRAKLEAVQQSIAEQEKALRSRTADLEASRAQLDKDKTALLTRAVKPAVPAAPQTEAPQATSVRVREEAVAKREAYLAAREKEVAVREATTAGAMAELKTLMEALRADVSELKNAPAPVAVAPQNAGPAVTRAQVQRTVKTVRQKMLIKGMLTEDLPQSLQSFAQAAREANSARELVQAQGLCERVLQTVDATPINHAFVEGKMARINRTLASHSVTLDGGNQKKVQELLGEATDAFSDGRYDRANKKINQICALLPGSEAR